MMTVQWLHNDCPMTITNSALKIEMAQNIAQNIAQNMAEKTNSLDRSLTSPAVKNCEGWVFTYKVQKWI